MADSSSGRDPSTNAGSDSAKHYTGTASEQHARTPATVASTPVTYRHPNGAVGNGMPPAADPRSAAK